MEAKTAPFSPHPTPILANHTPRTSPFAALRQDCSIWPPGGGPARGPRGRGRGLGREEEPGLPQWQAWSRSLGAVPIRAAVRCGR